MRERLVVSFPYMLAAVLPLPGLFLAGLRFQEHRRDEGARLLVAVGLGTLIWVLLLTA